MERMAASEVGEENMAKGIDRKTYEKEVRKALV